MELQHSLEITPSHERLEAPLAPEEREKLWNARIFGQVILIGHYVNAHMPMDLVRAWQGGETSLEHALTAKKFELEAAWSACKNGDERFSKVLGDLLERASAAGAEGVVTTTEQRGKEQEALRFTRGLLKLTKTQHRTQDAPTGYLLDLSEEETTIAVQLQAVLDRSDPEHADGVSTTR